MDEFGARIHFPQHRRSRRIDRVLDQQPFIALMFVKLAQEITELAPPTTNIRDRTAIEEEAAIDVGRKMAGENKSRGKTRPPTCSRWRFHLLADCQD